MIQIFIAVLFILSLTSFIGGVTKEVTTEDTQIYDCYKITIGIILFITAIVLLLLR